MKTLLLLTGLLATVPLVSAATITTLVEVRSGDETCVSTDFCDLLSVWERGGIATAWAAVEPVTWVGWDGGPYFLEIQAWLGEPEQDRRLSAYTFASLADSYLPPANGTAVFEFSFHLGDDLTDQGPRMTFNGLPLWPHDADRFTVPMRAGVPFDYVIELEATAGGGGGGRPRGYDFFIFPHEIAFVAVPEPSTAAMLLLTSCSCLLWRARRRAARS